MEKAQTGIRQAILGFMGSAIAIAVAGPFLAISADHVAQDLGLAVAISLPELSSSLSAARIRAMDLAYGNLFGSNAANMSALFFVDAAYTKGSLLADVSLTHALTAAGANPA